LIIREWNIKLLANNHPIKYSSGFQYIFIVGKCTGPVLLLRYNFVFFYTNSSNMCISYEYLLIHFLFAKYAYCRFTHCIVWFLPSYVIQLSSSSSQSPHSLVLLFVYAWIPSFFVLKYCKTKFYAILWLAFGFLEI
jgi:hypothetical protein